MTEGDRSETVEQTPVEAIRGATTVLTDLTAILSGRGAKVLLSLFAAVFLTRLLGPGGYGTVAFVEIVGMLIFTASAAWTSIAVRRYGREELERVGQMSSLTWNRVAIVAPLAVLATAALLGLRVSGVDPGGLSWSLTLIGVGFGLVTIATEHLTCLLETAGRMKVSAASQVIVQAMYVGVLFLVFVSGWSLSAELALIVGLASLVLLVLVLTPRVWRVGIVPIKSDRELLRRMLRLSIPVIGLMVSQYVFASIDVFTLKIFRDSEEVGLYAIAYQSFNSMAGVAVAFTAVLVPLFVSLQMAKRHGLIEHYFNVRVPQGLFVISCCSGLGALAAPLLVPIVFGEAFSGAGRPLSVLTCALTFLFATYLLVPILTLHEATLATALINAAGAVINASADLLFLGPMNLGILAPAFATFGALVAVFVGFHLHARRVLALRYRSTVDGVLFMPMVSALLAVLLIGGPTGASLGFVLLVLSALAIIRFRGLFGKDDIAAIERLDLPEPAKRLGAWALELGLRS